MKASITVSSPVLHTARADQVCGLFSMEPQDVSQQSWEVDLPIEESPWNIGLILGPSGSGKTTIAKKLWPCIEYLTDGLRRVPNHVLRDTPEAVWSQDLPPWHDRFAVVDGFPESLTTKEVTGLLSAVGFSSPPAWLRPYPVLSTGQKFRCDLARLLAHGTPDKTLVCDEFTSVVDRTVAQIGSAAVAKAVRARGLKFVAVSCHSDILDWLQPDWVYEPATATYTRRLLQRRPAIRLEIARCTAEAWKLFAHHHYLTGSLNRGATSWLSRYNGEPVAFTSWLPWVGDGPKARREHRTVVLPDYQGVGIGMALSTTIASMWDGLGYLVRSTTTHPGFIASRNRSSDWRVSRQPDVMKQRCDTGRYARFEPARSRTRITAGWRYCGTPMDYDLAVKLRGD